MADYLSDLSQVSADAAMSLYSVLYIDAKGVQRLRTWMSAEASRRQQSQAALETTKRSGLYSSARHVEGTRQQIVTKRKGECRFQGRCGSRSSQALASQLAEEPMRA